MSSPSSPAAGSPPDTSGPAPQGVKSLLPFDILRVVLKLLQGWKGLLLAGILGCAAAAALGWNMLRTKYTVQVQLVRRETPNTFQASQIGESFRPREFTSATVMSLMVSPSILEKTGAEFDPPVDSVELLRRIELLPDKNTELITVAYTSRISPVHAAKEINIYARNVVQLIEDLQAQEAKELLSFLGDQASRTEGALNQAQLDLQSFTRESGLTDPSREIDSLLRQVGELDLKIEMAGISRQTTAFRKVQAEKELARQDPAMQRLQEAKNQLAELLLQYTDKNPFVIDAQAKVKALEEKAGKPGAPDSFQATGNTVANSLYLDLIRLRAEQDAAVTEEQKLQSFREDLKNKLSTMPGKALENAKLLARVTSLETTRALLTGRQREAQLFAEKSLGYYRIFANATPESMEKSGRARKILILGFAGGILAAGALLAWRALRAAMDDRLVSPSDLRRTVGVPILAMLPPEELVEPESLDRWRFTTWAEVVRVTAPPPEGALVAGFLSAMEGEGKSTWLGHLGAAALDRGLKVLRISCTPPKAGTGSPQPESSTGTSSAAAAAPLFSLEDALRQPERVLEILRRSQPAGLNAEPAPDFEWTPEWRALWRRALEIWSAEPALAVLAELPPASRMDSLLLAETLPKLFWLSESGRLRRKDLSPILKTIRGSHVPITASLLNRVPPIFLKMPDLGKFGLCLAAGFFLQTREARAQTPAPTETPAPAAEKTETLLPPEPPVLPVEPPLSLDPLPIDPHPGGLPQTPGSGVLVKPPEKPVLLPGPAAKAPPPPPANPKLAAWQETLTLGPGDIVDLQVYGYKQYTRKGVPIGPDGTLTYLQVIGFKAGGLTVDQLRDGLTKALGSYIQNARVIVIPQAWRSKKYYVLGTVVERGVFTLDRPMTLMEAAARARGLETGLVEEGTVEIADMKRAFIARSGQRLPVDFTKLFYDGDMSQNIALQPGDYIYFPSNTSSEIYVLGSVNNPGVSNISRNLTAIGAITNHGGFTRSAWKTKVLIVRGSLEKPQTIVVDAGAILRGKKPDVPLEPLDIVYITDKPWKYAAEILELTLRSFVQSAASSWASDQVQTYLGTTTNN